MLIDRKYLQAFLKSQFPSSGLNFADEGWGSVAFFVDDNVIRFPKKGIVNYINEQKITNIIRENISKPIPEIEIVENAAYPYSIHKKLAGNLWKISEIEKLDRETRGVFIKDCAEFLNSVHKIDVNLIKNAIPDLNSYSVGNVKCEELHLYLSDYLSRNNIDIVYDMYEMACNRNCTDTVFMHADFRGGNSLVDENYRLVGVFDWGNSNTGERAGEFQSLYYPESVDFLKDLLTEYEALSGVKVHIDQVRECVLTNIVTAIWRVNNHDEMAAMKQQEMTTLVSKLKWFL